MERLRKLIYKEGEKMSRFITINITDKTTPISQAGFGLGFILDPVADAGSEYDYVEIRSIDDIPANATQLAQDMANAYLSQQPNAGVLTMQGIYINETDGTATDIEEALNQVIEVNDDWYGLLLASREQADIEAADGWIPANKLFITSPVEADWTTLSAYSLLSDKTGVFPSTTEQYIDAAIMSRMFATDPGSATWKWKQLSGVENSGYTNADVSSMLSPGEGEPNMNPVIHEMGADYTAEGKTVTGEYLDIQRAIDWMDARLTENIFQLLINEDKISYTNAGISQITSAMKEIFRVGVNRGVIAEEDGEPLWNIDAPRRQDIPQNARANRNLPDVNFDFTAAGAIHSLTVSGVVQV
ncbi:DUF3383 family protein [Iocasia frigidifontis]|uniref:DUF3383 family protein n=2 Tax=Iocasia fonsfrigidae TaxID=2682810 RepID=A0A8A7K5W4_9FIRM|nr:DUF3383 family protein [Iocasia fonsfrigidae]